MYASRITRNNPAAFVILIDQSGSMQERVLFGTQTVSKASAVATVTNNLISELIYRSSREDGVADYFELAVVGYGGSGLKPMLGSRGSFVKISHIAALDVALSESTVEHVLPDGRRLMSVVRERKWVEAVSEGGTPMLEALEGAFKLVSKWSSRPENKGAYPPTVFNITDGEATDGSDEQLIEVAKKIREVQTDDGNVLLINIHIATSATTQAIVFPSAESELPINQRYANLLYNMSSQMPTPYCDAIRESGLATATGVCRGMSFNCSITEVVKMMDIGSVNVNSII